MIYESYQNRTVFLHRPGGPRRALADCRGLYAVHEMYNEWEVKVYLEVKLGQLRGRWLTISR